MFILTLNFLVKDFKVHLFFIKYFNLGILYNFYNSLNVISINFIFVPLVIYFLKRLNILNNLKLYSGMLFTFVALLFFQISTYHYETLDWDINAFLVTSLEFVEEIFLYQYENKPPLLFAIFYLFSIITNKSLIYINLLNDLIICLILAQTIIILRRKK